MSRGIGDYKMGSEEFSIASSRGRGLGDEVESEESINSSCGSGDEGKSSITLDIYGCTSAYFLISFIAGWMGRQNKTHVALSTARACAAGGGLGLF